MRHIGHLPDETQARRFSDFLVGRNVPNDVEREDDGSWSLWITNEDQVPTALEWLAKFTADPNATEFAQAAAEAERVRQAEAEELAAFRRRIHTRKSLFPKIGKHGVGYLTYALIVACVAVAVWTNLGAKQATTHFFYINEPGSPVFLEQVRQGQVWRLLSPILLHLSISHILFNMVALYYLGCMIEARCSSWVLALLVLGLGLGSNLAQYIVDGPGFGGMSGVVYGLLGYAWMRGKYDRASGLVLDRTYLMIALVWLVVCFTGMLGPIANTAHVAGLVLGILWGRIAAYNKASKPE